jgi:hypothetical protein
MIPIVASNASTATIDWLKCEGAYSRSLLDAIRPRAALQRRLAAFEARSAD